LGKAPSKAAEALGVAFKWLKEGQSLSVGLIAKEVGCSASYLYRCKPLMDFLASAGGEKKDRPRGSKDRDTGTVEAWDDDV
jgi:hypothetical protein